MEKGIMEKMQVYITKDCSYVPALAVNISILGYAHCGSRQCLQMVTWIYCLLSTEFRFYIEKELARDHHFSCSRKSHCFY